MREYASLAWPAWSWSVAGPQLAAAPPATFPAQQRPPGDPAVVARGASLYAIQCRSCHGVDLRGGDLGGPNLLRSQLVLDDQAGETIAPVVMNGRNPPGGKPMPALPLPRADIDAIAEYIHSVAATAQPQGAPPPGTQVELKLLVGNARSGERYFAAQCAGCHSVTGDLAGIAGARAGHRAVAGQLGFRPPRRSTGRGMGRDARRR